MVSWDTDLTPALSSIVFQKAPYFSLQNQDLVVQHPEYPTFAQVIRVRIQLGTYGVGCFRSRGELQLAPTPGALRLVDGVEVRFKQNDYTLRDFEDGSVFSARLGPQVSVYDPIYASYDVGLLSSAEELEIEIDRQPYDLGTSGGDVMHVRGWIDCAPQPPPGWMPPPPGPPPPDSVDVPLSRFRAEGLLAHADGAAVEFTAFEEVRFTTRWAPAAT